MSHSLTPRRNDRSTLSAATPADVLAACLLTLCAVVGCGKPPAATTADDATASSAAETPPGEAGGNGASSPASAPTAAGWPAGDDPAASAQTLRDRIETIFNELKFVEQLIYPIGWTQRRYPAEKVTVEIVESDGDGRPQTAVVGLTYQKLNSVIQPTQEAAAAETDLLPYPADETREEMTGHKIDRRWPPTETEITYTLRDGKWVRTGFKTPVAGREGADWLDQIGVP